MIKGKSFFIIFLFCRSKTQKRGDDKERRKRSPSPKPTKIHLGRLTRNVTKVIPEWCIFKSCPIDLCAHILGRSVVNLKWLFIPLRVLFCTFQDHIQEIFSTYGKIKSVEMPMDRLHPHLSRCSAYVEFETHDEAQKALKYMDGGRPAHFCFRFVNFSHEQLTSRVIFCSSLWRHW